MCIEHYSYEAVRVILGKGDVVVKPGADKVAHWVIGELLVMNSPYNKPVGEYLSYEEAKEVNVDKPEVTLNFHTVESIDVLISNLIKVRTMMQAHEEEEDEI